MSQFESADAQIRALGWAERFLAYRPRSEHEITSRLRRQGFTDEVIEDVLTRLRCLGLVDDALFATFWKENRQTFRPRSRQLLAHELRQKGVDRELVASITQEVDDEIEAYRVGHKKAHSLKRANYHEFSRKLGAFLSRRGFSYEVVNSVVKGIWWEREGEEGNG